MRTIEGSSGLMTENFQNDVFGERSKGLGLAPQLGNAQMAMDKNAAGSTLLPKVSALEMDVSSSVALPKNSLKTANCSTTCNKATLLHNNSSVLLRPVPLKPIAPRAIRPTIPKRLRDSFKKKAYEEGMSSQETSEAAAMAQEWHRKWVRQEESGHGYTKADFYKTIPMALPLHHSQNDESFPSVTSSMSSSTHFVDDRQGAQNPSLGSSYSADEVSVTSRSANDELHMDIERASNAFSNAQIVSPLSYESDAGSQATRQLGDNGEWMGLVFNPDDQLSNSSSSASSTFSSLTSHMMDEEEKHKDTYWGGVAPSFSATMELPVRPVALRPVALRPVALRPPQKRAGVPQEIKDVVFDPSVDAPSPMSFVGASLATSSDASMRSNPKVGGFATTTDLSPDTDGDLQSEVTIHFVDDGDNDGWLEDTVAKDYDIESAASGKTIGSEVVASAKDAVLHSLAVTQGDVDSEKFKKSLSPLIKYYSQQDFDTRLQHLTLYNANSSSQSVDGMWLTLSKPSYFGCLGENDNGDPMYTLGRMSFDMFSPTNLVCSLQGNFNPVEVVNNKERQALLERVPKSLREEVESGHTVLRTYHIVAAFTIESASELFPDAPNKDVRRPIKGIMTTYGYSLPDPETPNRHSIWFTGGRIQPNDNPKDIRDWKRLFTLHPPQHSWAEKAKLLAVKLLMGATLPDGMNDNGSMDYSFTRPIGGHGMAYMDVIYLDETLRIVRGHRGTIFVFSRLRPSKPKRAAVPNE